MKKKLLILTLLALTLTAVSCKSKDVPGRVRAPRHCNSCTKWSYTPQENYENTAWIGDEG